MHSCNICDKKVVSHKPSLFCDLCCTVSHYQCNKLTKSDATYIIQTAHKWTCSLCNVKLFPLNIIARVKTKTMYTNNTINENCGSCSKRIGPQYTPCQWCDSKCHTRCTNGQLGCTRCANNMIPGYNYNARELTGNLCENIHMFNPYDDLNMAHSAENNDEPNDEAIFWQQASECLLNCNYRQQKSLPTSTLSELKIMSLNIR